MATLHLPPLSEAAVDALREHLCRIRERLDDFEAAVDASRPYVIVDETRHLQRDLADLEAEAHSAWLTQIGI